MDNSLQSLDQVRASALDMAVRVGPKVLVAGVLQDPVPVFGMSRLAESGMRITIAPWVKVPDHDAAVAEINKAILEVFGAQQIVIALPQREVRMLP